MSLFEIKVEITPAGVEAADTVLQESGLEGWNLLEDVIVRRAWVQGIGADAAVLTEQGRELAARLAEVGVAFPVEGALRALPDQDWKESYKAHFRAWHFGPLHWVPEWEKSRYQVPPGEKVLWLDPGLAFGTGNHETTRLCCEDLVAFAAERAGPASSGRRRTIDAGCGSGILALSAALLGLGPIRAFDNDPEAVRVSEENARANALPTAVTFVVGDLVSGWGGQAADLVLANIQADILQRFHRELLAAVAPGGWLVLSGILASELAAVRATFAAAASDWTLHARTLGEWSSLRLVKP